VRHRGDFRDFVSVQADNEMRLYPYAKDLYYRPDGNLIMTIEIYDDENTYEKTFGFMTSGPLKEFLDQLWDQEEEYGN
jgi:hypothetical protein